MKNLLYAQSGGVTAVINASAAGVIETARNHPQQIGKIYAGLNGIIGVLTEDIIDTTHETGEDIANLCYTPAGAFGSCRYKLGDIANHRHQYERLVAVFKAHNIGYFLYNGGGDSQDTANKVAQISLQLGYPVTCIGIPKTIDNDLAITDCSPGFGSVAKYVATSTLEASLDVASMAKSSTKVFILEVMGRHAGWIAAAAALARSPSQPGPHIILFPEIAFDPQAFLTKVQASVDTDGYCVIVASEGIADIKGEFIAKSHNKDSFGHAQLGGVAPYIASLIKENLGFKYHFAIADYLQRAARHIASKVDVEQAYALGQAAVAMAVAGRNSKMPTIVRTQDMPYAWEIGEADLTDVANFEKKMPADFISNDGFDITLKCHKYLAPLIEGEDFPKFVGGIPQYVKLKNKLITKVLEEFTAL